MLTYDEYMKQQKDYCDALDLLKREVANMRSAKANEATMTVRQLEPRIPELEGKINTLNAEIKRLDGLIATKQKQSEYDEQYWKKHYLDLETKLNNAHDARTDMFKGKDDQYDVREKAITDSKNDLDKREQLLIEANNKLIESQVLHNDLINSFIEEKSVQEDKIKKIMSNLNGHINEANAEKLKQKELTVRLEEQAVELSNKIKQAESTIASIGEAQKKLDEASTLVVTVDSRNKELDAREEKLNESHVKSRANLQRDTERSDAISLREQSLSEREKNIKLAEASIAKRG